MKKKNLFSMMLMLVAAAMLTFTACGKDDDDDDNDDVVLEGAIGLWVSEGDNVAPLLLSFDIVKIIADFKADGTYQVESYDPDGVKTEFAGVYTMEETGTAEIWNIVLQQSTPTSLTSEGIFQIIQKEGHREMRYEVVQTDPSLGFAPPTAEGGFGSTGGGALGEINIQYYVEITE